MYVTSDLLKHTQLCINSCFALTLQIQTESTDLTVPVKSNEFAIETLTEKKCIHLGWTYHSRTPKMEQQMHPNKFSTTAN